MLIGIGFRNAVCRLLDLSFRDIVLIVRDLPVLHTSRPPTQCDMYQKLYWYNWFSWWWALCCSKHVENWNKRIRNESCASSCLFTRISIFTVCYQLPFKVVTYVPLHFLTDFVWLPKHMVITYLSVINRPVFMTEAECAFCEVGTELLNTIHARI